MSVPGRPISCREFYRPSTEDSPSKHGMKPLKMGIRHQELGWIEMGKRRSGWNPWRLGSVSEAMFGKGILVLRWWFCKEPQKWKWATSQNQDSRWKWPWLWAPRWCARNPPMIPSFTSPKKRREMEVCSLAANLGNGTPKSSISIGCSMINRPFWGSPWLWKPPHDNVNGLVVYKTKTKQILAVDQYMRSCEVAAIFRGNRVWERRSHRGYLVWFKKTRFKSRQKIQQAYPSVVWGVIRLGKSHFSPVGSRKRSKPWMIWWETPSGQLKNKLQARYACSWNRWFPHYI